MNNILTFNLRIARFSGFFLIVFLIGFYIFQISEVTRASFTVADYEKKVIELDKKFKNLQIIFSDASSLPDIEGALLAKGYEKVSKINYIQVLESAVVAK